MRVNADHHFVIGHYHLLQGKPCQDHALSWSPEDDSAGCIAVSDGCSTGGETDLGARIMTFAMLSAVRRGTMREAVSARERVIGIRSKVESIQQCAQELLGLSYEDLYATQLFAYLDEKGGFAYVCGDGVLAAVLHDGTIYLWKFSWEDNMPFYPSYSGDGLSEFVRTHGGIENRRLTEERWVRHAGAEKFLKDGEELHTVREGISGIVHEFDARAYDAGPKFLALFTDGITHIEHVDWKDAAASLLGFKTTEGSFAKRRLNAALAKEFLRFGRGPLDDIAYAVIHVFMPVVSVVTG